MSKHTHLVATNYGMVRMTDEDYNEYLKETYASVDTAIMIFEMRRWAGIKDNDPAWDVKPKPLLLASPILCPILLKED